jgi:cysteine-rich repeat protein
MKTFLAVSIFPLLVILALGACAVPGEDDTDSSSAADTLALCGNGTRDPGEQCDDGNTTNLDGCSKSCTFEQAQRMDKIEMMFATSALCPKNIIGVSLHPRARQPVQKLIANAIADGSLSVITSFPSLPDNLGVNAPRVTLGSIEGTATATDTTLLDGWFKVKPNFINGNREPLHTLTGSIVNSKLSATGTIAFTINFPPSLLDARLSSGRYEAKTGPATKPSGGGASLGHLATENLDPNLKSFETMTGGEMCGNVSAAALAKVAVPTQASACSARYDAAVNSLLDIFVGGCKISVMQGFAAIQPDTTDPGVPVAGAGAPYKLIADATTKKVNACQDKNGADVPLATCLASSTYSTAFNFTTKRVVVR